MEQLTGFTNSRHVVSWDWLEQSELGVAEVSCHGCSGVPAAVRVSPALWCEPRLPAACVCSLLLSLSDLPKSLLPPLHPECARAGASAVGRVALGIH